MTSPKRATIWILISRSQPDFDFVSKSRSSETSDPAPFMPGTVSPFYRHSVVAYPNAIQG